MADQVEAPTWNEYTRTLKQQHDGFQITVAEDEAGCIHIDISATDLTPRPLRLTIGGPDGKELMSTHPDAEEWDALAAERAPQVLQRAKVRQVREQLASKLPMSATRDDIIQAALEAAAGIKEAVEEPT